MRSQTHAVFFLLGVLASSSLPALVAGCASNEYLNTTSELCMSCPSQSTSPVDSVGITSCQCSGNYWMDLSSLACQACPSLSSSEVGSMAQADCTCIPGAYQDVLAGNQCTACGVGSFCPGNTSPKEVCETALPELAAQCNQVLTTATEFSSNSSECLCITQGNITTKKIYKCVKGVAPPSLPVFVFAE